MRLVLWCVIFWLAAPAVQAQNSPIENTDVTYNGVKFPCKRMAYDAPPELVEAELVDKIGRRGGKVERKKGWIIVKNTKLHEDDKQRVDAYFMVEAQSKQVKDKSFVYFFSTEPGVVPAKRSDAKAADLDNAVVNVGAAGIIAGTSAGVALREADRKIALQEKMVADETRSLEKLQDNYASMQRQLEKLQKEMEANAKDRDAKTQRLASMKEQLETMRKERAEKN